MFKVLVGFIVLITCINAKTTEVKLSKIDKMNVVNVIDEKDMSKYEIVKVSDNKTDINQKSLKVVREKPIEQKIEVKTTNKHNEVKSKKSILSSSTTKVAVKLATLSNKEKAIFKLKKYIKKPYTTKKYKKQFLNDIVFLIKNEEKIDIEFVKNMSLDEENIKELIKTLEEI